MPTSSQILTAAADTLPSVLKTVFMLNDAFFIYFFTPPPPPPETTEAFKSTSDELS